MRRLARPWKCTWPEVRLKGYKCSLYVPLEQQPHNGRYDLLATSPDIRRWNSSKKVGDGAERLYLSLAVKTLIKQP